MLRIGDKVFVKSLDRLIETGWDFCECLFEPEFKLKEIYD